MRDDAYRRAYGLKAALNLMYPLGAVQGSGQGLRTVDSKRRGSTLVRARAQASAITTFEVFDIDRLRDVVGGVDGRPVDREAWGAHIAGADPLKLNLEIDLVDLGRLCRDIDGVAARTDYRDQFAWLDNIQPVTDPILVDQLRAYVIGLIQSGEGDLDLAPPEILEWSRIHRFQFPFDRRRGVVHQDLRLQDLAASLRYAGRLDDLDYRGLRGRRISVLDVEGERTRSWSLWSCLNGGVVIDGHTYVIDEGDFFEVEANYLHRLDTWVDQLSMSDAVLPEWHSRDHEGTYNEAAAESCGHLLLDKKTVRLPGSTAVELCDLLTDDSKLIHVKRNSGSSDLSHLFSQGVVSATALHDDAEFRAVAAQRVTDLEPGGGFNIFEGEWRSSGVEVAFAIRDARWAEGASRVLPFFSKVNLRRAVSDLESRGYRVTLLPIGVAG